MAARLIKVDRNGTEYWFDPVCPKCGGTGHISGYEHIEGGICFQCGGSGNDGRGQTWKKYTPEYAAKLEARRIAKAKKEVPETNAKFLKSIGFSENGEAWLVVGVDTYSVKEDLKEAGAKFTKEIGWHFDHEQTTFKSAKIYISDVAEQNEIGAYYLKDYIEINAFCDKIRAANTEIISNYVGEVGDKVEKVVTLKRVNFFETNYGYYGTTVGIYCFEDENGNVIVWKTASAPEMKIGEIVKICGKVKELGEYKGTKQTVLTRCKITK